MDLTVNDMCFACGQANPIGLKLTFRLENDRYKTELATKELHQGYVGIVHGGIIACALDEAMARLIWIKKLNAVTAHFEVRFKNLVLVGQKLSIAAKILRDKGKIIEAEAHASLPDGTLAAAAKAKFVRV